MTNRDITGRIIGAVVFLAGIAILIFVFTLAYGYFSAPGGAIQINQGSANSATNQLGAAATRMFVQLALLIVMAIVGSLIAARGVQFYFGASHLTFGHTPRRRPREVPSDEE